MHSRDVDLTSFSDPLTGLPSARVWSEGVTWAVEHARDTDGSLAVALLDLDRFDVLAEYDPLAADRLLKGAAAAWHSALDDAGLVARLFAGRFGLLLPERGVDAALETVEVLRALVPAGVTCSAGLAVWEGEDAERLASRADGALVGAKLRGRDRAVVAS
jgi:diguanylate cyclase